MSGRIAEASRAITEQASLCSLFDHARRERLRKSGEEFEPANVDVALWLAEPSYFAPDVCDLVFAGSSTIPSWPLRPSDLYTLKGFAWLATPYRDDESAVAAFAWMVVYNARSDKEIMPVTGDAPLDDNDGIRLGIYAYGAKGRVSARVGEFSWRFGEGLDDVPLGLGASHSREAISRGRLRVFGSLLAFTRQRVLTKYRSRGNRAARKDAESAGMEDRECLVVILRKGKPPAPSENGQAPDWSCRWWVAGHWRQQPCGESRAERRPTWISPYIKGPDDKPVKPAAKRLFAVVR